MGFTQFLNGLDAVGTTLPYSELASNSNTLTSSASGSTHYLGPQDRLNTCVDRLPTRLRAEMLSYRSVQCTGQSIALPGTYGTWTAVDIVGLSVWGGTTATFGVGCSFSGVADFLNSQIEYTIGSTDWHTQNIQCALQRWYRFLHLLVHRLHEWCSASRLKSDRQHP